MIPAARTQHLLIQTRRIRIKRLHAAHQVILLLPLLRAQPLLIAILATNTSSCIAPARNYQVVLVIFIDAHPPLILETLPAIQRSKSIVYVRLLINRQLVAVRRLLAEDVGYVREKDDEFCEISQGFEIMASLCRFHLCINN